MTSNNNNAMFKYDSIDAMLQDPDFKFKTYPNGSTHSLLKVQSSLDLTNLDLTKYHDLVNKYQLP